jgi:RNA 3'-terminal phosphate cyclase (ATP)
MTIELDGAAGEGGGQILRSALALSMCTGQAVRISRIRARRAKPGLMRQHLACVHAAQAVSGARVDGAELGSQSLHFAPGQVCPGEHAFAVGTAGSCTLVLQTVLPALMLADAPSRLRLSGGTHNPMAPPYPFIERSFAPLLRRLGVGIDLTIHRHGFYPAGGGDIEAAVYPACAGLRPFDLLERGSLRQAFAECLTPGVPHHVATRELDTLGHALGWSAEQLLTPGVRRDEGPGNALMATLSHEHVTEVFTGFGAKGVRAEQVALGVVSQVRAFQDSRAAVGPHLADQWALPLALAVAGSGRPASYSISELTAHAATNFETIERFLPVRFDTRQEGSHWVVGVRRTD